MPSDPVFLQAQKAIADKIEADYSGGYSGLDLSATGTIVRGAMPDAPMVPSGCVVMLDCMETQGKTLGYYSGTITYEIYGFIGGGDVSDRNDNAIRLGADFINALTTDRSLGLSTIDDILCSFAALDGDRFGIQSCGIAYVRVEVTFSNSTGV